MSVGSVLYIVQKRYRQKVLIHRIRSLDIIYVPFKTCCFIYMFFKLPYFQTKTLKRIGGTMEVGLPRALDAHD